MIYTVISSLKENRIDKDKRDCRIIRQPLSLLYEELENYIEHGKNEMHKAERRQAYTTLLCALKTFYSIDFPRIERNEYGKPYLADSDIRISLSHSNGVVAVCLSDEGEVGVDLQSEIEPERAERLKERFFTSLEVKNENISTEYYYCDLSGEDAEIYSITLPDFQPCATDFSARWVSAESIMKLIGHGFADADKTGTLAEICRTEIKTVDLGEKYYLAVSVAR
jgi:phosphopantetheinyl transferase